MAITTNQDRCYDHPAENAAGNDHLFVVQAKSGNASAFGALYERHSSKIYHSAFQILRNRQDAEDSLQRSFQRAFTSLRRFREDSSFSTWMTRVATNEALQLLRQRRRNKVLLGKDNEASDARGALDPTDKQPTPEQALVKKEMRGAVVRAISKLQPRLHIVVLLREVHGLTNAETARRLGLTVSAAKARTFRAKCHLRRDFERKYEGARVALRRSCNHGR